MRPLPFLLASSLGVLALAGCSADVSASAEQADADSNAANALSAPSARVSIDALVSSTGERKVNAVARFVRARDGVVDENALRMVHASLALPAVGTCAAPDIEPKAARGVTLADLGSVSISAGDSEAALVPREVPDVADLVSGVVYATRSEGAVLPESARYSIRAGGGDNVPAFTATAVAPSDLKNVRISASESDGDNLDFTWDAGDASDLVYIDIASRDGSADEAALRCVFTDAGRASISASASAAVAGGIATVHRVHRESIHASGIGAGEVQFDFARAVALPTLLTRPTR